jgi:hypothetical protein
MNETSLNNGRKPAPEYHINPEAYVEGDNLD